MHMVDACAQGKRQARVRCPPSATAAAQHGRDNKLTLSISSVGFASFFSVSSNLMAFSAGSLAATHLVSALMRDSSSRWSMVNEEVLKDIGGLDKNLKRGGYKVNDCGRDGREEGIQRRTQDESFIRFLAQSFVWEKPMKPSFEGLTYHTGVS